MSEQVITFKGKPITELSRDELVAALTLLVHEGQQQHRRMEEVFRAWGRCTEARSVTPNSRTWVFP